ncbi:oligopeptide ABC transporter permease OppC [Spiroplasma endosymbiont of Crioceris asparagi]|uniref:oligopeptide ABC transporter permease OppC n=1 Tax=Spiroplasma endosymbiont of Crioceris asparagi TaxID=3066286 RepID=UPI0030D2EDBE
MSNFELNHKIDIDNLSPSLFEVVGIDKKENEQIYSKPYSYWKSVLRILFTSNTFIISFAILAVILLLAIFVPIGKMWWPDPDDTKHIFEGESLAPSWHHWFGLGKFNEDYWTTIWIGTRETLIFAFIIAVIQITVGIIVGSIWGYNKKLDIAFIELTRFLTLIPTLVLWLIIIFMFSSLGEQFNNSIFVVVFAVSLTAWIPISQTIRVQVIMVKNSEYNVASQTLGTPGRKILSRNIFPKILPVVIQTASFSIPDAIAIDSTLNYFGFSFIKSDDYHRTSLGKILNLALANNNWEENVWWLLFPLIMIAVISALFFLVAKTLADSLDPKNHR